MMGGLRVQACTTPLMDKRMTGGSELAAVHQGVGVAEGGALGAQPGRQPLNAFTKNSVLQGAAVLRDEPAIAAWVD